MTKLHRNFYLLVLSLVLSVNYLVVTAQDEQKVFSTENGPGILIADHEIIVSGTNVAEVKDIEDDVEIDDSNGGNVSLSSRSGKYQYDEFLGAIDGYYPDSNSYNYGEFNIKLCIILLTI